jgi:hypothetical protein
MSADHVNVEDPDVTSRTEDEAERLRRLRFNLERNVDEEPAAYCAFLLGEHTRNYCGPTTRLLVLEIRAGRLRAAGDLDRVPYGEDFVKRRNPGMVPIARDQLRVWLMTYGTPERQRSAAAVWCGLFPLAEFERRKG